MPSKIMKTKWFEFVFFSILTIQSQGKVNIFSSVPCTY
jgi:hypothetical protein